MERFFSDLKTVQRFRKHRKNERGFPSLADPGSQERCHGIADSGPSGMPSSGCHLPVRMGVFRVFLGAHKNSKKEIFAPERSGGWVRGTRRRRQPAWPSFGDFEVSVSASGSNRGRPGRQAEIVENLRSDGGIFDSGQYTHPAAAARTFPQPGPSGLSSSARSASEERKNKRDLHASRLFSRCCI